MHRNNITLIGMPGSGKSTVGVVLAKILNKAFLDTDITIQQKSRQRLQDVIDRHGVDYFIRLENQVLSGIRAVNSVIATGGSAVYGAEAMKNLMRNSIVIYLKIPLNEVVKRIGNHSGRGIAIREGQSIENLFYEREILYQKYAEITIDCENNSLEQVLEKIYYHLTEAGIV